MRRTARSTILALLIVVGFAGLVLAAPSQPVAVVSTLSGDVSVARSGSSMPLKFKDSAFPNDVITTGDQSMVRLLERDTALVAVQQRSVVVLGDGSLNLQLRAGRVGVSAIGRRLGPDEFFQIDSPNVRSTFRGGNVIVKTSKVGQADQTTVYVAAGSAEVSHRNPGTRRTVKLEGPRQLTVTGKTFGESRALSAADTSRLLAELRAPSPQHVDPPDQIDRVIVKSGRAEAVKQTKLVAEQLKRVKEAQRQHDANGQHFQSEVVTSRAAEQGSWSTGSKGDPVGLGNSGPNTGGSGGGGAGNGSGFSLNKDTNPNKPVNPNWSDPAVRGAERSQLVNPALGGVKPGAIAVPPRVQPGATVVPPTVLQQPTIRLNSTVTVEKQQVAH